MFNNQLKVGDLIHIPANVWLYKQEDVVVFGKFVRTLITSTVKTDKPEIAILLEKTKSGKDNKDLIFLNGEYWHCLRNDMFVYDGS